ncbi:MAG: hypothetical protein AAF806_10040 [Bacteroidota bacterium]
MQFLNGSSVIFVEGEKSSFSPSTLKGFVGEENYLIFFINTPSTDVEDVGECFFEARKA